MQFYPFYRQDDPAQVECLIHSQVSCNLLTTSKAGMIHNGIFNHDHLDGKIVLHLNKTDEQVADLKVNPQATVAFQDLLCLIPSYWVDAQYGGAATMYYRYAEFTCDAILEDNPQKMQALLQTLMDRYQPEGHYQALDPKDPIYKASFSTLTMVTLTPVSSRTKWKLGQNKTMEQRLNVLTELRKRGTAGDLRAADEVERWLKAHGE